MPVKINRKKLNDIKKIPDELVPDYDSNGIEEATNELCKTALKMNNGWKQLVGPPIISALKKFDEFKSAFKEFDKFKSANQNLFDVHKILDLHSNLAADALKSHVELPITPVLTVDKNFELLKQQVQEAKKQSESVEQQLQEAKEHNELTKQQMKRSARQIWIERAIAVTAILVALLL